MPLYQTSTLTGAGDQITLATGNDLVVAVGVLVGSDGSNGVRGQGTAHDVQVYGTVSGYNAISLGISSSQPGFNTVRVMPGGALYADFEAIFLIGGSNTVVNDGHISGDGNAIYIAADLGAGLSQIINRGIISGAAGITSYDEAVAIWNYGTIGTHNPLEGYALSLSSTADTVKNYGTLLGSVSLGAGNDLYDGRTGTIEGIIFGRDGNDKLYAGAGDNEIQGDAGNDTLIGGVGGDVLNGGTGTDRVSYFYADGSVTVNLSKPGLNTGEARGDTYTSIEDIGSSRFDDKLSGNSLNNLILGNDGDDTINGSTGKDTLSGGDGNDTFVFNTALKASTNVDTISDFDVADDRIQIENAIFTGLSTGTLTSAAFRASTTGNAADATDRIMYETDTGNLYFDADGNGAGAKIHFATVDTGLALTNADFVVI